jgi:flavin reductase (DIM6/NTAB) family NADH-FMN oxidoreductase RutF
VDKIKLEPLSRAYRLLNPGVVVLVSVSDGTRDNVFPVTWNMPVRDDPPMVAILSGKDHFSYPFIVSSGEFGLNVPDLSIADAVLGCGLTSGADVADKFERFGLHRQPATRIGVPLVAEAVGQLECRVCQVVDLGDSALLVAQVLAAAVDPRHFRDGRWSFTDGLQLIHHVSGEEFCVSERAITARRP